MPKKPTEPVNVDVRPQWPFSSVQEFEQAIRMSERARCREAVDKLGVISDGTDTQDGMAEMYYRAMTAIDALPLMLEVPNEEH